MKPNDVVTYAHYCAIAASIAGALFGSGHYYLGVGAILICYSLDNRMQEALFGADNDFDDFPE